MPGIFAGAMLSFALSIDDFVISNFNSGTTVTFPLYIFGAFQRGVPVEVNCIAMILFGITVAAMVFTTWQQRRAEKMAEVRPDQEEAPLPAVPRPSRDLVALVDGGKDGTQRPMWKPISSGTFAMAEESLLGVAAGHLGLLLG